MTIEGLRQLHDARPFRPFVMHISDGRRVRVEHPEFLARSPSGRTVIVFGRDDSFEMFDLLHVSSVSVGNGKKKHPKSNGKDRG